jgi:ATP-dependent Clp protease ATP-binding subunit ClpA
MEKNKPFGHDDEEDDQDRVKKTNSATPNLDKFGKDLTKLAALGKLDPVVGREDEIDQTIEILNKRKKNNPILVGEPGVGKCICDDTQVVMRNDLTGEIYEISVSDFINILSKS